MVDITRRKFMALAVAGAAAAAVDNVYGMGGSGMEDKSHGIPRRPLGKTGENLSILAFGGFHLIEALPASAERMLNYYLDAGGNFIETAISYGDSESKIGEVMKTRRNECFLSTKTHHRTKAEAAESIDTSLRNLRTDHIDNVFVHCLTSDAELDAVLGPNGAMEALEEARAKGKIRFISVSAHSPEVMLRALQSYPFDAIMKWINYYDRFNFPLIYDRIIPLCQDKGIGIVAMKPIADGLLYRSAPQAFRWTWSRPITSITAGNNTMEMLKANIEQAKSFKPLSKAEEQKLYETAPEYADYVCRRCGKCDGNGLGLDIEGIFELEGYYDRQMYTGRIPDPAEYALRERLRFWFANQTTAQQRYAALQKQVPKTLDARSLGVKCPYKIDVVRKLKIAAWKLTGDTAYLEGVE